MLGGQLKFLARSGFDVSVVCGPGELANQFAETEGVTVVTLPLRREFSFLDDGRTLVGLYRIFRKECPDIVHVGTPKAGLLGGLAAWLAHVPVRLHDPRAAARNSSGSQTSGPMDGRVVDLLVRADRDLCESECATPGDRSEAVGGRKGEGAGQWKCKWSAALIA